MGLLRFTGRLIGGLAGLAAGMVSLAVVAVLALALMALFGIAFGLVFLVAKIALGVLLISWLFRKAFGRRRHEPVLVGPPVASVAAPLKDRYQVEAERELDRDLGL